MKALQGHKKVNGFLYWQIGWKTIMVRSWSGKEEGGCLLRLLLLLLLLV
jgi:hypothetical protein